jgi:glycosyltransferase involved in cell wall biosynthesis
MNYFVQKRNILFLIPFSHAGGVEVVTVFLANKFICEGHSVYIVFFGNPDICFLDKIDTRVQVVVLSPFVLNLKNILIVNNILHNKKINFVINQRGEKISICLLLKMAKKKTPIKLLSLYHNQPGVNIRIASIDANLQEARLNIFQKSLLKVKKQIITKLVSWNMKISYLFSDTYILLSTKYIDIFCKFIDISNSSKIRVIPNPVTLSKSAKNFILKKKKIIYVARLVKYPKHPERIIELWETISTQVPEWSLEILGEGIEKTKLENYCTRKNIERVNFRGFVNSEFYYTEASILLLASDYEGFPLVLVEAMYYGVVPVAYRSFAALTDIIIDNENGLIVNPDKNNQYSRSEMIKKVLFLIHNEKCLIEMSKNAQESSKYFSMENIYKKWIDLFTNC